MDYQKTVPVHCNDGEYFAVRDEEGVCLPVPECDLTSEYEAERANEPVCLPIPTCDDT